MGIWGNIADRLTGALCKNLITDVLTNLGLPLDKIPGQDVLGGILGNGQKGNQKDVPLVGGILGNNGNAEKMPGGLGSVGGLLGNNGNSGTGQMMPGGLGSAGGLLGNNGNGQMMPGGLGNVGGLFGGGGQRTTKPPRRRTTPGSRFPFDF